MSNFEAVNTRTTRDSMEQTKTSTGMSLRNRLSMGMSPSAARDSTYQSPSSLLPGTMHIGFLQLSHGSVMCSTYATDRQVTFRIVFRTCYNLYLAVLHC